MPREMIPIVLFIVMGFVGMSFSPLGRAFARRIGGSTKDDSGAEIDELRAEVSELRAELDDVRARLGDVDELQGRVDFAERMLAQLKGRGALPGAS